MLMGVLAFTGCKREGCTDRDSAAYDPDAKNDDGSCQYQGEIVFWYDQATADYLTNICVSTSLTYYVDGQVVGSSAASVFFTGAPNCGQNSTITVTKDLGSVKSKSFSFSIKDDIGDELWNGTDNFTANTCLIIKLRQSEILIIC